MGTVKSCCKRQTDDKLMVTKMDLSHCGCLEVPNVVFNAERCIETLILASNQITSLPPQLFHCQEMKHLNLIDNCLDSIPPAIGSFLHLVSLKLDKNNLQELPDNLKMCKKVKRLSLNNNPWKQMPNIVTQLISLEELYISDCELNYLPASVGRLSKLKIIELRNNNLCNLPLSMARLELLARLDISDNEFTEFPICIPQLKSLTELLIDNNDIEEVVDIKNLVCLEHLDASYNHISNVSETIGCCINLNMLNLSFNYIEQLPNSVGNIINLQTLQLEMNELTEIPKAIGKLSCLEELNLCNNKLYSLPNTIGLLRNLRNLNVSRNIIEEFPPEIGSCTKLAIINAAYNRLQVLPSEIGYLNNLKVLDLVGNFLMYLPITIINLREIRAIWLSANQNVPLIPFTEDLNLASGERFLTNIALPQLGEIPFPSVNAEDKKVEFNEKSTWNKKIRFAEDEDILPGKLHRTPTPFPKELRSPNRKHQKTEGPKPNDNYVNVVDGKVSEQETLLLQPVSTPKTVSGLLNFPEGAAMKIKEANIRRNHKDLSYEISPQNFNESGRVYINSEYSQEEKISDSLTSENEVMPVKIASLDPQVNSKNNFETNQAMQSMLHRNTASSSPLHNQIINKEKLEKFDKMLSFPSSSKGNLEDNCNKFYKQKIIYSNLINDTNKNDILDIGRSENEMSKDDVHKIRKMYHNDVIYEIQKDPSSISKDCQTPSKKDCYIANVNNQPKYLCSNSTICKDNFIQLSSQNTNEEEYKNINSTISPPSRTNENTKKNCEKIDNIPQLPSSVSRNVTTEYERLSSKQSFISLAEEMKTKNISPPSYEIAKMYSTKAALFENNRRAQLKTN